MGNIIIIKNKKSITIGKTDHDNSCLCFGFRIIVRYANESSIAFMMKQNVNIVKVVEKIIPRANEKDRLILSILFKDRTILYKKTHLHILDEIINIELKHAAQQVVDVFTSYRKWLDEVDEIRIYYTGLVVPGTFKPADVKPPEIKEAKPKKLMFSKEKVEHFVNLIKVDKELQEKQQGSNLTVLPLHQRIGYQKKGYGSTPKNPNSKNPRK